MRHGDLGRVALRCEGGRGNRLDPGHLRQSVEVRLDRLARRPEIHRPGAALAPVQHVETDVRGDPVEPGAKRCPALEAVEGPPCPDDPADVAASRETTRLALVAALQHLPPRQRAVLILCEVLRWKAGEVAELLETSVASVNSALQRARATLEASDLSMGDTSRSVDEADAELLARYVEAFERYDMDALTSLIREDAIQSMPPFDLWLQGRDDIFAWWWGPGIGCKDSRVIPTVAANGAPAFGQYKPSESGSGYDPWALQVLEVADGRIVELTFFLDTETLFPLFGLPPRLDD
jgi:RNA polymerase sigma-70 factor (ECF subfamily)